MNSRDRCETALNLEEPDRVPYYSRTPHLTLKDYNRTRNAFLSYLEFLKNVCKSDLIRVETRGPPKNWKSKHFGNGLYVDEWGRVVKEMSLSPKKELDRKFEWAIEFPIKSEEDFMNYSSPDPLAEGRLNEIHNALKKYGDEVMISGSVECGLAAVAEYLTGYELLLKSLYLNPSLVHKLQKIIKTYSLELGKAIIDLGCSNIWMISDVAYKSGPMFSMKHFKEFESPYLKEMVDTFKKRGATVVYHSDGDINPFIKYITKIGFSGINPIEPSCMSLNEIKSKFGDRLCLIGNMDINVLSTGNREDIIKEAMRCIKQGAVGGGFIFSEGSPYDSDIFYASVENILAIPETLKKYGSYPIKIPSKNNLV